MSRKHFHNIKNNKKMLQYGVKQGMGAFRPKPAKLPAEPKEQQEDSKTNK